MTDLVNATLLSIAAPPQATRDGDRVAAATAAVAVPVFVDAPRRSQLAALANLVSGATAVLYAAPAAVAAVLPGSRLGVRLDGSAQATTYQALYRVERIKDGGLSHVEIYLKSL